DLCRSSGDEAYQRSADFSQRRVGDVLRDGRLAREKLQGQPPVGGAAGGTEKQITSGAGESNGRFSPDGHFVSFTNTTDGPSRIAIAPWDEKTGTVGSARMMTAVSSDADGAIWSPDSHHLLLTTAVYPVCSDKPKWAD